MEYYIVVNEWNYPTESGRDIVGDFDTREEAAREAESQYKAEYDNFLDVNRGEIYQMACGEEVNHLGETIGYSLHSSPIEEEDFFFQSVIKKICMKDCYTGYERPSGLKRLWMMFSVWININFKKIFK